MKEGVGAEASSGMEDRSIADSRSGKIVRFKPKGTKLRNLVLVSLLLAVVTLVCLWCSRSQPLLVVWRFSFMLCFVSSLWTIFLAETMGLRVFIYNSYGILLALCADTVLSPSTAVLIAHFSTHFAACLLGYALADHRQREGTERAANLVRTIDKEEEFTLLLLLIIVGITISVPMLGVLTALAWLVWHAEEYRIENLMPMVLCLLSAASVIGIFVVDIMQLRGSLISPLGFIFTIYYALLVFGCHLCFSTILGDVAAMVITWVACLCLTGLLGYCISVLATFKQIERETALVELQNKRN